MVYLYGICILENLIVVNVVVSKVKVIYID